MPTLRLEIDLDSDVYPELYATLDALRSARARGERLRQLAATGLVWELVRVRGPVALGPATAPGTRPPPEPPPAVAVALREVKAPKPPRSPERRAAAPRPRAADGRGADFIDLAIDAPAAPPVLPVDADGVARELPVLLDVVAETPAVEAVALSERQPEPVPEREPDPLPAPPERVAPPEVVYDEDTPLPEAIHVASLAQKPASRSRLMRMKEKGLFKNG